jgi:hypothetical protein
VVVQGRAQYNRLQRLNIKLHTLTGSTTMVIPPTNTGLLPPPDAAETSLYRHRK